MHNFLLFHTLKEYITWHRLVEKNRVYTENISRIQFVQTTITHFKLVKKKVKNLISKEKQKFQQLLAEDIPAEMEQL